MQKIQLMCDAASDFMYDEAKELGISLRLVPITHGNDQYKEGILPKEEFIDILENSPIMPSTAQISPDNLLQGFKEAYEDGCTHIIVVTISSTGSGMYQNCFIAKELFEAEYGEDKIHFDFIDSRAYTYCYGDRLREAAQMVKEGKTAEEIVEYLHDKLSRISGCAGVYSLKFARKSGRISGAAAFAGEALGLKPIIHLVNGKVNIAEKVRGEKNIIPKLIEMAKREADDIENQDITIFYGRPPQGELERLIEAVETQLKPKSYKLGLLGASLTLNAGPATLGFTFYSKRREDQYAEYKKKD